MSEVGEELDIGRVNAVPVITKGMDAKFHIAEISGIEINSVNRVKRKVGLKV
jgi:hypothetical protein